MSAQPPMPGDVPGKVPGEGPVDYLAERPPSGSRQRWTLVAGAAAAVVAVGGVGAWGFAQLMGGGPGAAAAVPDTALAYVALDLDPSGGQKIEAMRTMRKFPALREELGLDGEDLRRTLVEAVLAEGSCDDLDYEDDFEPWLGDRMAVAALPGDGEPSPLFVVQATDETKAREGVAAVVRCGDPDGTGEQPAIDFVDGYLLVAQDADTVAGAVDAVAAGALADDPEFQRWVDEAGGEGILTAYVAAGAPRAFAAAGGGSAEGGGSEVLGRAAVTGLEPSPAPMPDGWDEGDFMVPETAPGLGVNPLFPFFPFLPDPGSVEGAFEDFEGAAMVVRFDDAALEVEMAAGGLPGLDAAQDGDAGIRSLPDSTAVALGFAVGDTAVADFLDSIARSVGQDEVDRAVAEAEAELGVSVPEDLQTMLGDGVAFAMDGSIDLQQIFGQMFGGSAGSGPATLPLGLRITGDPDAIVPILEKVVAAAGAGEDVVVRAGDGAVAVGPDADYVARLAEGGDLGGSDRFEAALPELGDSAGGLYVDFDAGDWLAGLLDGEPDAEEARANLEPLASLGVTGSVEDGAMHTLLRLSTD